MLREQFEEWCYTIFVLWKWLSIYAVFALMICIWLYLMHCCFGHVKYNPLERLCDKIVSALGNVIDKM